MSETMKPVLPRGFLLTIRAPCQLSCAAGAVAILSSKNIGTVDCSQPETLPAVRAETPTAPPVTAALPSRNFRRAVGTTSGVLP